MAVPTLTPVSQMSKVILPVTGNPEDVSGSLAFGVYSGTEEFLSGAAAGSLIHVVAILDSSAAKCWAVHGSLIVSGDGATPFGDAQL